MERFVDCFADLEDPRTGNATRHSLTDILFIAICSILCNGETCADMALFGRSKFDFLKEFLSLENGVPSHDTFSRVFRLLDPAKFAVCFSVFMQRFCEGLQGVVAIDGKTMRRSYDRASGQSALHLVSAWACDQRLVLGQVAVDEKSNEIKAVPKLLDMLRLAGTIVTGDAMNCQRQIAQQITDQDGDYVLALKRNQGTLHDDVVKFLDDPETKLETAATTDGDHGRIEQRMAAVNSDIEWLKEMHDWPGLEAVGKITSIRESKNKTSSETRYFLLSTALSPSRFLEVVRQHWAIENNLHWTLDVIMHEDQARNRKDHGPENLALLRKFALNLAKLEQSKGSMRGKLKRAGWDNAYLVQLLAQAGNTAEMR